jgi:hypothetical protein
MPDSMLDDIYKGGRTLIDTLGIGEAASIAKGAKDWIPGGGYTAGADKVMGPLGYVTSGIDLLSGGWNLAKGVDTGDTNALMDGVHDTVGGTAGMLGNVPGPVGAVAKAFSAGYTVGDWIAPTVFGSEKEANAPHMEQVPADGVFKPSTGNSWIDKGLDVLGVRD